MIRPFTSTGFLSKIHWHAADLDYEKFHLEHLPKSCLPSDYSGSLNSVAELHKQHKELLMSMREFFMIEESQVSNEF